MKQSFDRLRRQYGQSVTLTGRRSGETVRVRAFLQPILRQREDGGTAVTPLGGVNEERWLYLGPGETEAALGDWMDFGGLELVVQQARTVLMGDVPVYRWAVLRERKGYENEQRA